jgi:chemotaxis methyl-accepting protein methylase
VPKDSLKRYFVKEQGNYRVSKELCEMVIFATQNLVMDPPFIKLDILTCRNMMIYIEADLQKKLLALFTALTGANHIYQQHKSPIRQDSPEFPAAYFTRHIHNDRSQTSPALTEKTPNLKKMTETLLLQ